MSRGPAVVSLVLGLSLGGCFPSGGGGTSGNGGNTGGGDTTGTGGGSSATGGTSGPMINPSSSYPQNTPGANFPYPQNHALPNCSFPSYSTDTVAQAYTNWKAAFFDGSKVIRPENGNDTVSEGIGYGMLIAVFMNDQPMFDTLSNFGKQHPSAKNDGLMTWCIPSGQSGSCSGSGSATDGDEDMAYALLMASKQWNGGTYSSDAMNLIKAILAHDVSGGVLEGGDGFNNTNELDPSYFAPSYYRAFAAFDTADSAAWMSLVGSVYGILAKADQPDGLVPNWVNQGGTGVTVSNAMVDPYFGYDACRTPFRIGLDYCLNGEPAAQSYAQLISGFYAGKATATSLAAIDDGYTTTGGNPSGTLGDYAAGMAFLGPAGIGAMAAGQQDSLRDLVYVTLRADTTQASMKVPGTFSYYHGSWGVLSLLAMSGNFWDMTQ